MSGPRDPWRWSGLSKQAIAGIERRMFERLNGQARGFRVLLADKYALLDHQSLSRIEPRETRPRDRSLRGKARRHARKATP